MKIGICLDWHNAAALESAGKAGADFAELNFSSFENATAEEIAGLKATLDRLHLPVASFNCMLPGARIRVTGWERDHAAAAAFLRATLEKLEPIAGARHVVFGSGGARRMEEGDTPFSAFADLVVYLRDTVAPIFREYGWTCSVEPLSECNYLRTTADGAALVKAVGCPEVRLLADIYHMEICGEDLPAAFAACPPLRHVHIAEKSGRYLPSPDDPDDYRAMFAALEAAGYDGCVSIEGRPRDDAGYTREIVAAVATLKAAL